MILRASTLVAIGALVLSGAPIQQGQSSDEVQLRTALERYDRKDTVGTLTFKNVKALTSALTQAATGWEEAQSSDRIRRRRVAALFALELALADLRAGQGSLDRVAIIEWACDWLDGTPRDEFHNLWMRASYAVLQPAGAVFGEGAPPSAAHLRHGLSRFPGDNRLKLADLLTRPIAWALSSRPGAKEGALIRSPMARLAPNPVRPWPVKETLEALQFLVNDTEIGPEAQAHVGIIYFHRNELSRATTELTIAAGRSRDPFVRNLAWLVAGLAEDSRRHPEAAATDYEEAVRAIPQAKASATALAWSWFIGGRREEASIVLDRSFSLSPPVLDPWQRVADMMRFVPAWMAEMHQAVGHGQALILLTAPAHFEDPQPPAASGSEAWNVSAIGSPSDQRLPTFRVTTTGVLVDVSVRAGKVPVSDLGPSDFEVFDNGVRQRIEEVSKQALPLDLSLILDYYDAGTWGASLNPLSYSREQKKQLGLDAANVLSLLRHDDRARVITVENEPLEVIRLAPAGEIRVPVEPLEKVMPRLSYGRSSAIYDAVGSTLMRFTPFGRRHLVLTFSEGVDDGSVLTASRLLAIAERADAVMHLSKRKTALEIAQERSVASRSSFTWVYNNLLWPQEPWVLGEVCKLTGGSIVNSLGGSKYEEVRQIIERLRQSYVIRYEASGVEPSGWHRVEVRILKAGKFEVQARKGYWGG